MSSLLRLRRGVILSTTVLGLAILFTTGVSTQSTPSRPLIRIGGRDAAAGEVLVKYRTVPQSVRAQLEAMVDADETETLGRGELRRVRSSRLGTPELLAQLRSQPDVEYAEPNYAVRALVLPNDPSFNSLWGLFNSGFNTYGAAGTAGSDIDAAAAWNITVGSRANVVGVIDTGIDYNHPDLAANIWSAPTAFTVTIGGQSITCLAGSHGFNAITKTCNPMDDAVTPHGTHVAGTIGAVGNNGVGVVGVNWVASMMGLKFLDQNGAGFVSNAVNAIEFAVQAKAAFASSNSANVRVLSNSWAGGGFSQALLDAINTAGSNDMLFVAAAGNDHANNDALPSYPASYAAANVVSVASSTNTDGLSSFSNYGASSVHLAAPGTSIFSTGRNNTYVGLSGTSMAAPQVSGAAALVLAMCSAPTSELRALLLNNVEQIPALASMTATGGRLNVIRAMQACTRPLASSVALTSDKPAPQGVGVATTFTAIASGGQAPYQYRWFLISGNGATYTELAPWGASNTLTWTPTAENASYQVQARARSAWNTGNFEAATTVNFPIVPLVSAVTLTADRPAPQGVGTTTTFTATASGGGGSYQYRWWLINGTTYTPLTEWVTSNQYTWTPTAPGTGYQIQARARGSWNTGNYEAAATLNFPVMPVVTSVTLTASRTAPQGVGTPTTFTASASGGQGPYQYRWYLITGNGAVYTELAPWGPSNTLAWTPTSVNSTYQIQARARSAWNTGNYEVATVLNFPIVARTTSFTLAWDANPEPQVAGYFVYIGTSPGVYTTTLNVGRVTAYTFTSALPGTTYYVSLAAYAAGPLVGPRAADVSTTTRP